VWEPRPGRLSIRNFVFRGELVYLTDIRRNLLNREQIFQTTARFENDDAVRVNVTDTFDRLDRPFEIARGVVLPVGDYRFSDVFGEAEATGERAVTGRVRFGGGDFYSGRRHYWRLTPAWRPSQHVSFETTYEFNDITLREGAFATHVVNARMNLNLSNRWLTTTLAQYDSASRRNTVYFRLNYIYRPGDDLFLVYNQSQETGAGSITEPDRSLMVKMTYSVDF
jgi:hypothetical protein